MILEKSTYLHIISAYYHTIMIRNEKNKLRYTKKDHEPRDSAALVAKGAGNITKLDRAV